MAFSGLVCVLNFNAECTIQTGAVKSVYKMNVVKNTFSLKRRRLVIPFTKKYKIDLETEGIGKIFNTITP